MRNRLFCTAAVLSLCLSAAGQEPRSAATLVERGITALGGEPARKVDAFRMVVQGSGLSASGGQARNPRATSNLLQMEREYVVDLPGARGRRVSSQMSPGQIRFYTLAIATPEGARTVDLLKWRSGTDIQSQPAAIGRSAVATWARFLPHTALRQALAAGAALGDGGQVVRDGRTLDRLSYTDPAGTKAAVYLDATSGLPIAAEPAEAPGSMYEYGDYHLVGDLQLPRRVAVRSPAFVEELRYTTLEINPAIAPADFELPGGYAEPPAAGEPRAVRIAPNVYRLDGMPGNYHSAFIVEGKDVSVFDAPRDPAWSEIAMRMIRGVAGDDARVVRVLVSHHHADHTGGLAPYVAAGATVVCGEGVDEFLRRALPESQRAGARFEVVRDAGQYGRGASRIAAYPVPNEHADGALLFHLPASRILLQGDLFAVPERGPVPPAFAVTADLQRVLDTRRLRVDTIVSVHGRQATAAELRHSLLLRSGLASSSAAAR